MNPLTAAIMSWATDSSFDVNSAKPPSRTSYFCFLSDADKFLSAKTLLRVVWYFDYVIHTNGQMLNGVPWFR